ncbi:TolC family protein [Solimonas sp. SE-A11]|uniref:TolC family protein n=1 Tax=Solimonas sp. SE-A11 TaxID=3054954 RepID=UPI00259CEC57|nr:TolC family protein [Solimonas sp. SE-A11]
MFPPVALRRAWICVLLLSLAGCASLAPEQGHDDVRALVAARRDAAEPPTFQPPDAAAQARIDSLLQQPLDSHTAVTIALLQNPALRIDAAEFGLAQADLFEAGRLANPRLSLSMQDSSDPAAQGPSVSVGIAQNVARLLTRAPRRQFAAGEFERAKTEFAGRILALADDTESAWFELAGASQVAELRRLVLESAEAAADLAQRMQQAGTLADLDLALRQAAASEARIALQRTEADQVQARLKLAGLMGLPPERPWQAAPGLPAPADSEEALPELQQRALRQRLDLDSARRELDLLREALGMTRRYRYLGEFEVGLDYERETDRSRLLGPSIALELPIFDQGQAALGRSQARLQQSEARLQRLELDAARGVAAAHARVATARTQLDHYREQLLPQRERVVARTLEMQQYMLLGVFELLAARRDEFDAYQGYLETLRDYWLARVDLARETGGSLPGSGGGPVAIPAPAPEEDHSSHHMHHQHGEH